LLYGCHNTTLLSTHSAAALCGEMTDLHAVDEYTQKLLVCKDILPSPLPPYVPLRCIHLAHSGRRMRFDYSCDTNCECKVPKEWILNINTERELGIKSIFIPETCPFLDIMKRGVYVKSAPNYKCAYTCECKFPEGIKALSEFEEKFKI